MTRTIVFDLETASSSELYMGRHVGPFVRLVGWMDLADNVPHISTDPQDLLRALATADVVSAHNGFGFDNQALAQHCGADYDALSAKTVDTLPLARLVDPPMSKGMPTGYYSLDPLAKRLGHTGKSDDIKRLGAQYNGFDRIPRNKAEHFAYVREYGGPKVQSPAYWQRGDYLYRDYLRGDLSAQAHVHRALVPDGYAGLDEYAKREMGVVALQGRMSLNGWAVDKPLLLERVAEEAEKRARAIAKLAAEYGMPTHYPDTFKVLSLREWMEPRVKGQTRTSWRRVAREGVFVDGQQVVDVKTTRTAFPSLKAVRRYAAMFPEAAVARGYAVRQPGEAMKSPWTTSLGKAALIEAFGRAGALTPQGKPAYPRTPTGEIKLGKDALGRGEWYCNDRRQAYPGMLSVFGEIPAVVDLVETILLASGARMKYAEILQYLAPDGRVHAQIGDAQGSGRWAMIKASITNMGSRGDAIKERAVMVADSFRRWEEEMQRWLDDPEGVTELLVTCDLSAVDVRAVAIASQDPVLIAMLQPNVEEDFHTAMGRVFFNDPSEAGRKRGKPISHGSNYGQGARAIALRNGLDQAEVQAAMDRKAAQMPGVEKWKGWIRAEGDAGRLLDNHFGRKMRVSEGRSYTQAPALVGQGMARDIMCESLLRFVSMADEVGINVRPMLRGVIHDELVCSVPAHLAMQVRELMVRAFTWEFKGVPILCDAGKPTYRWSEAGH